MMIREEPLPDQLTRLIAEELGETEERPIQQIRRMIDVLGEPYVRDILDETRQREAAGGIMTLDGSRRRTPGGAFFWLTRQRLLKEGRQHDLRVIFPIEPFIPPQPPVIERVRRRKRLTNAPPTRRTVVIDQQAILRRLAQRGPDQMAIQATIMQAIGNPPDLRKCSIHPTSGAVTLLFNFPGVAEQEYGERIRAVALEHNLAITIDAQVNQQAVREVVGLLLPPPIQIEKLSLLADGQTVRVRAQNAPADLDIAALQDTFTARTGLRLELVLPALVVAGEGGPVNQQQAMDVVRARLGLDCLKVSAEPATATLTVRFAFPDVAQERYAAVLAELSERIRWAIAISPMVHQGELERVVRTELDKYGVAATRLSVHQLERMIVVRHTQPIEPDVEAQMMAVVAEQTGWRLVFRQ